MWTTWLTRRGWIARGMQRGKENELRSQGNSNINNAWNLYTQPPFCDTSFLFSPLFPPEVAPFEGHRFSHARPVWGKKTSRSCRRGRLFFSIVWRKHCLGAFFLRNIEKKRGGKRKGAWGSDEGENKNKYDGKIEKGVSRRC